MVAIYFSKNVHPLKPINIYDFIIVKVKQTFHSHKQWE